jgi:2'-5' RNA ligase
MEDPIEDLGGPEDIQYLQAYDEEAIDVFSVETDHESPRFGLPLLYEVDLGLDNITGMVGNKKKIEEGEETAVSPNGKDRQPETNASISSRKLHWTRLIHVAENKRRSNVYGEPRLRGVYNRLDDLGKVIGGSAEASWRLAYQGLVLSTKEGYKLPESGSPAREAFDDAVEDFVNDFRRILTGDGLEPQPMGGEVVDPSGMVNILLKMIAIRTRIPKRILEGSERGELASSQDGANWAGRIKRRRKIFAEPEILREFIDRLIKWGALPEPKDGYYFKWKPLFEMSALDKVEVADKKASAIQKLSGGVPRTLIEESEAREMVDLPPERPSRDDSFDAIPSLPSAPDAPDEDRGDGVATIPEETETPAPPMEDNQADGVMVAFAVPPRAAERLALDVEGALPPEALHITLAYLGTADELAGFEDVVQTAVSRFAQTHGPIEGVVNGGGAFGRNEATGEVATWTYFDSVNLAQFRQDLVAMLAASGAPPRADHGFVPHITLAYTLPETAPDIDPPQISINFSEVSVWWGSEVTNYTLVDSNAGANGRVARVQADGSGVVNGRGWMVGYDSRDQL